MNINFSYRIKYLRKEKNLTQAELAKALNTTQRKVSYWESGRIEPDIYSIWCLCDFFDVSADYLIGRKEY